MMSILLKGEEMQVRDEAGCSLRPLGSLLDQASAQCLAARC